MINSLLFAAVPFILVILLVLWNLGVLKIPVGLDRGKVKFFEWCGTGRHLHEVYWTGDGFSGVHPDDRDKQERGK